MKKRILVADDDPVVRKSLKKLLEDVGYEVLCAVNGDEAENKFVSERIDLLILDLDLPRQNGWNVFGIVNAQDPLLPVIIITGLRNQTQENLVPGVAAFLEKPIEVPVLLKAIEDAFSESIEQRLQRITAYLNTSNLSQPV